MEKVTIIIPIHNIRSRGFKRVLFSVYSLLEQKEYIEDIIIVDSSCVSDYDELGYLLKGLDVRHIHYPQYSFNKPLLLNYGIEKSKSKYVLCTDADYLFKKDFLKVCEKHRGEKVMMHKQVRMLPNMNHSIASIKKWRYPACPLNIWGTLANGACQYATRDFFTNNPYPNEMDGFSAMDNIMTYMAYNKGLDIKWIDESEILHQNHPIVNKMAGNNREKFDRNQRVLNDYINDNNLPCLLWK